MSTTYDTSCSCDVTTANAGILDYEAPTTVADFTLTQTGSAIVNAASGTESLAQHLNKIMWKNDNGSTDDDIFVYMKQTDHTAAAVFLEKLLFPDYLQTTADRNEFKIGHTWGTTGESPTDFSVASADTSVFAADYAKKFGSAAQLFTAYNSKTVFGSAESNALFNAEESTFGNLNGQGYAAALMEKFFPFSADAAVLDSADVTGGLATIEGTEAAPDVPGAIIWYKIRLEAYETDTSVKSGIHEILAAMSAKGTALDSNANNTLATIPQIAAGDKISFFYKMVGSTLTLLDDSSGYKIATGLDDSIGMAITPSDLRTLRKPHGKVVTVGDVHTWTLMTHTVKVIAF